MHNFSALTWRESNDYSVADLGILHGFELMKVPFYIKQAMPSIVHGVAIAKKWVWLRQKNLCTVPQRTPFKILDLPLLLRSLMRSVARRGQDAPPTRLKWAVYSR